MIEDNPAHRYEYQSINNQRISLVRHIQIWNQIGIGGSAALFVSLIVAAVSRGYDGLFALCFFLPFVVLWFSYMIQIDYDKRVVYLYPRIIALEILQDLYFYRSYLRFRNNVSYIDFIDHCEHLYGESGSAREFWSGVLSAFQEILETPDKKKKFFSSYNRTVGAFNARLNIALILVYFFGATSFWCYREYFAVREAAGCS